MFHVESDLVIPCLLFNLVLQVAVLVPWPNQDGETDTDVNE